MTKAYYNEFDEGAAAWLRQLIASGQIAPGDVDTRSIEDVRPDELIGYTQCHFFAGIGGWSLALRLAGWPDDKPVWTGSCPCQPFSSAGKGAGFADERHLWPAFHHLISQCRPPIVFGEQVASKDGLNWLDLVQTDLEGEGYATAAADLCAAGIGAPHIRQRLFWVAHAKSTGSPHRGAGQVFTEPAGSGGAPGWLANASDGSEQPSLSRPAIGGLAAQAGGDFPGAAGPLEGYWRDADWIACRDGFWRPVEPGTFPLAHGVSARVGRLRGYGNAIVPQVAAEFVRAAL